MSARDCSRAGFDEEEESPNEMMLSYRRIAVLAAFASSCCFDRASIRSRAIDLISSEWSCLCSRAASASSSASRIACALSSFFCAATCSRSHASARACSPWACVTLSTLAGLSASCTVGAAAASTSRLSMASAGDTSRRPLASALFSNLLGTSANPSPFASRSISVRDSPAPVAAPDDRATDDGPLSS